MVGSIIIIITIIIIIIIAIIVIICDAIWTWWLAIQLLIQLWDQVSATDGHQVGGLPGGFPDSFQVGFWWSIQKALDLEHIPSGELT